MKFLHKKKTSFFLKENKVCQKNHIHNILRIRKANAPRDSGNPGSNSCCPCYLWIFNIEIYEKTPVSFCFIGFCLV